MKYAVQTQNLTKEYNKTLCVDHIDLRIPEGSIYGFLGPNGAGKSTTMKMLLGLVKPTEGKAQILGQTLNDRNRLEILRETGSLIESPSYYAHLTGRENLQIVCLLKQVPEKRIDEVLHIVRMEKQQNKKRDNNGFVHHNITPFCLCISRQRYKNRGKPDTVQGNKQF